MHNNSNNIDNYREQIQKRISQLESKLKTKSRVSQHLDSAPWEPIQLQDTNINSTINNSHHKSTYNKGKMPQLENHQTSRYQKGKDAYRKCQYDKSKENQNYINQNYNKSPVKNNTKTINKTSNKKEDCRDQLFEMMQRILQGQKNIEMQISQLKNDVSKEATLRKTSGVQLQAGSNRGLGQPKYEQVNQNKSISTENVKIGSKTTAIRKNQKVTLAKANPSYKKRAYSGRKNRKDNDLTELMELVQNQRKKGQRLIINEEMKANIWKQVQARIKESESDYKDTIHRNNKHEHDHLINTFQLQNKLKQQLIRKVYQECNQGIYK